MITSPAIFAMSALLSAIFLSMAVLVLRRAREVTGAHALAVQLFGIAWWTGFFGTSFLDIDLLAKHQARDLATVGALATASALAWFAAEYTNSNAWLTPAAIISGLVANVALAIVTATNIGGMLNPSVLPGADPSDRDGGALYWANLLWVTLLLAVATALFLRHHARATQRERRVARVLLATAISPWLANFLRAMHFEPFHIDPVLIGMTIAAVGCAYAFRAGQAQDIEVMARNAFVRDLSDGVIVLADDGMVAAMSAQAAVMVGVPEGSGVGLPVTEAVADPRAWEDCLTGRMDSAEVRDRDGRIRHIRIDRHPLRGRDGHPLGVILVLRDLTGLHVDQLTGVGNRRCFHESTAELIDASVATGQPVCIAAIDLDHLKQLNDTEGHIAGDRALVTAAEAMRDALRVHDRLVRLGGDEFVAVLPGMDLEHVGTAMERVRASVAATPLGITITVGVAAVENSDDLLRAMVRADEALYEAKRAGRNRVVVHSASLTA